MNTMAKIAVLVASLLVALPAIAQVKQWIDANGVTHFGNETPKPREPVDAPPPKQEPGGKAKIPIERSHAGLSLGDDASSYRNSRKWFSLGPDKFGAEVLIGSPPANMTAAAIVFVDGRLSKIKLTYADYALGKWEGAVKSASEKYGPPRTNGSSLALWIDGRTGLSLEKDFKGGIETVIEDTESMRRYHVRSGAARPTF